MQFNNDNGNYGYKYICNNIYNNIYNNSCNVCVSKGNMSLLGNIMQYNTLSFINNNSNNSNNNNSNNSNNSNNGIGIS
jgi:hypothetical protein